MNVNVGKNFTMQVGGDANMTVDGNARLSVGGDVDILRIDIHFFSRRYGDGAI